MNPSVLVPIDSGLENPFDVTKMRIYKNKNNEVYTIRRSDCFVRRRLNAVQLAHDNFHAHRSSLYKNNC